LEHVLKLTSQNGLDLHRPKVFSGQRASEEQDAEEPRVEKSAEKKEEKARPQLAEVVVLTTSG
jgi:hypothetical protein